MLDKYQGIFCWPRPVPCYDAVPLVFWGFLASLGTAVMGGRSRILDPGFLSVTKQGQSLSSRGVGVFLCSFVSQSPGAVQTWMEHGGFPGGLEGLNPCFLLQEGVCSHSGKAGHQFYLGCELWHLALLHGCASRGVFCVNSLPQLCTLSHKLFIS